MYKTEYPGTKTPTQVQNSHPSIKPHSEVQNLLPESTTLYLSYIQHLRLLLKFLFTVSVLFQMSGVQAEVGRVDEAGERV
jgi:hypothetical protein